MAPELNVNDFVGKFLGPEKILEVRETGTETHRHVPIVEVITDREDKSNRDTRVTTTTFTALNLLATDKAGDWNSLQNTKLENVVRNIMAIATDYGVNGSELHTLLSRLGLALATRFEHAAHIKFEGNDDEFVPGGNEFHTWSLAKAESVIVNSHAPIKTDN